MKAGVKNRSFFLRLIPKLRETRFWKNLAVALAIVLIASVITFIFVVKPAADGAEEKGKSIGEASGQAVGAAVGSVKGATEGVKEGYDEGTREGLSAKDTVAEIANTIESNIKNLGKLEVLVANVDLSTYHEVSDKYGALYLARGSAVFTIDLNQVYVTYREGLISVVLPRPEVKVTVDPAQTELLAEWQDKFFNGTDSEGFKSYFNSIMEINKDAKDQIENYSELMELASQSAISKIEEIAKASHGNKEIIITVSMRSN